MESPKKKLRLSGEARKILKNKERSIKGNKSILSFIKQSCIEEATQVEKSSKDNTNNLKMCLPSSSKTEINFSSSKPLEDYTDDAPIEQTEYTEVENSSKDNTNNLKMYLPSSSKTEINFSSSKPLEDYTDDAPIEQTQYTEYTEDKGNETLEIVLNNDPAQLIVINNLTFEMVSKILELGPCQPQPEELSEGSYPKINGHRFLPSLYRKILSDGSVIKRDWLSYSKSKNCLFCIHCILFPGIGKEKPNRAWVLNGFKHWSTCSQSIICHETSSAHVYSSLKLKFRQCTLPLIPSLTIKKKEQVLMNKEIIKQLIDITLFLASHNLAFRGHRENGQCDIRGNFKDLCSLLSKYSPVMANYIGQLEEKGGKKRPQFSFISWRFQNHLIDSIAFFIRTEISNQIKKAKFFSIAIDSTFDVSHKEQVSFIFRYLDEDKCKIQERLLGLKDTSKTTGKYLFDMFKEVCNSMDLNWTQYLVGQSYDGASNMRGQYNGLQNLIKNENTQATFIWCCSHRLNLIIVDSVSDCINALDLFGNLERLYDFISCSKFRSALYDQKQKLLFPKNQICRLKRVSTTRWMSHKYALDILLKTFIAVLETLESIQDESNDKKSASEASGFLYYLLSKRFIYTAFCFKNILTILEPVSNLLQKKDFDLLSASYMINKKYEELTLLRNDIALDKIICEAETFLTSIPNYDFHPLIQSRSRKKKKMPGEQVHDNPLTNPFDQFCVNTYFNTLDTITSEIKRRFFNDGDNTNTSLIGIFKDLSLLTKKRIMQIKKNPSIIPHDAFLVFGNIYKQFINTDDLKNEYLTFIECFENFMKAEKLPKHLHKHENLNSDSELDSTTEDDEKEQSLNTNIENNGSMFPIFRIFINNNLQSLFPNIYILLKISLTLPVGSVSTERSFSKLKIVKNRLRSTMTNARLENLMMISCEYDISINYEEIINNISKISDNLFNALH